MSETAVNVRDRMERMNLRYARAQQLVSAVLHEIGPLLDPENDRVFRDAHDVLIELFMQQGVEIITDHTRHQLGLQPRVSDGWTPDEIMALERARLEAITRPIFVTVPNPNTTEQKGE